MKTQAAQHLMFQAWWEETLIYSDHFFDTTATITAQESDDQYSMFSELQMIRMSFESADYPYFVSEARQYLLNSMAEVMLSFRAFFNGDTNSARLYMQTAQHELLSLQDEIDRLGFSFPSVEPYIH